MCNGLKPNYLRRTASHILNASRSDKDRPAKPEEIVRQLWIKKLLEEFHYPKERIKVEYARFGSVLA